MALQTFKNLSTQRQTQILTTAYKEFGLNGYQSTSLSVIIKKLNIAKGSFYRYFDSKKSLYAYLLKNATEQRLSKLNLLIEQPGIDFFELLKQNFINKIKFDIENPVIGAFLHRVMHERDNSEVSALIKSLIDNIIEQTKLIITLPKFKNQLAQYDTNLMAFSIFNMQLWLYDYVVYKYNINPVNNINNNMPVHNLQQTELNIIINQVVDMLKTGIQLKQ